MKKNLSKETYAALFSEKGGHADGYLADHYDRFEATLREFKSTWNFEPGQKVLDIGAHWLHQAVMWNQAGFEVLAFDLPGTFEVESVRKMAEELRISLISCPDMQVATELDSIPSDSIDVVLFTEIMEHITFNPVTFWRKIHHVLKLGGRIVITTPNYYSWRGRAWSLMRYLSGHGGGIKVSDILGTHTYAHHWREYSKAEVVSYFKQLSPDFKTVKARYVNYSNSKILYKLIIQSILNLIPFLRPNLHIEIELVSKRRGIVVEPNW